MLKDFYGAEETVWTYAVFWSAGCSKRCLTQQHKVKQPCLLLTGNSVFPTSSSNPGRQNFQTLGTTNL